MNVTAYDIASRFLGLKEMPGALSNPAIISMLRSVDTSVKDDSTPWCSAFVNCVAALLGLPRSKSLAARSWLRVGTPIELSEAKRGFDIVIFKRGINAPGPDVYRAPGHVAFYISHDEEGGVVRVLGGNQGDSVSIAVYGIVDIIGIRRLYEDPV